MFRKSLLSLVFAASVLFAAQLTVFAQYAPVNGRVELLKADGTREAVAGALIEVFRIDIKAGGPTTKTNKKGEFNFAGIMYGGEYTFSISAANCSPILYPGVKAGQERLVITVYPGNGKKFTEEEVRKGVASAKSGDSETTEESAEDKAARADLEKKNAEILAKNKKMQEGDEVARRTNDEGNAALKASDFDLALAKFVEGVAAVPDFVGSTPILLSGEISALKGKAYKIYKEGATSTDPALRKTKYEQANAIFDEGLKAFQNAIDIIARAAASADPAEQKRREAMKLDLYSAAMEIHRLKAVTRDGSKADLANAVITEYISLEPDAAKKIAAQMVLGDIMRTTGDLEKAVAAYRQVLATNPDNAEATGKLGLSLFGLGAASDPEDKEKEQEGLNYMQKYTEMSPVAATDSPADKELKTSVKETVEYLKAQKMAPQKPASTKKRN